MINGEEKLDAQPAIALDSLQKEGLAHFKIRSTTLLKLRTVVGNIFSDSLLKYWTNHIRLLVTWLGSCTKWVVKNRGRTSRRKCLTTQASW